MKTYAMFRMSLLSICLAFSTVAVAQQPASLSPLQSTLNQSAEAGKFTFIVFHRDNGEATRTLHQQTKDGTQSHSAQTTITTARVDDPAEGTLVTRFGIARAPMPMTVIVAPNGAITGLFPRSISEQQISAAIVPPTMMRCMKELQNQKLVFVCMTRTDKVDVPLGVQMVQQLPQFKDRMSLVAMQLDDPAEARFYQQMQLDPAKVKGPHAVLIAPPGVLIGHFDSFASADTIAAAIHKAGQCCNDPNCKHGHAPQATSPPANRR